MTTWRDARPPRWQREPRVVGESLGRMARRLGAPPPEVATAIFARWAELVGETVAAHATPRTLRGGVLTVVVDQPAWATQLRLLSGSLLARLAEVTVAGSEVHEVRIVVGRQGGGWGPA